MLMVIKKIIIEWILNKTNNNGTRKFSGINNKFKN